MNNSACYFSHRRARSLGIVCLLALLALWLPRVPHAAAADGPAHLVKDINTTVTPHGSEVHDLTVVGSTLYFFAEDGNADEELWKSDGTAAGTQRVADLAPGNFTNGYRAANLLTNVNGTLFFIGHDYLTDKVVWYKTDGTTITRVPGDYDEMHLDSSLAAGDQLDRFVIGSTLYFIADHDHDQCYQLWKTDGTTPKQITQFGCNAFSEESSANSFANLNGTLFFSANDGTHGRELWKSDGTTATRVASLVPAANGLSPSAFAMLNTTLFFAGYKGTQHGVWKTDGTTVTQVCNQGSSTPESLTVLGSTVAFVARADDGTTGLWKTNGATCTHIGTVQPDGVQFTAVGTTILFTAENGEDRTDLWKSDGTTAGTVLVKTFSAYSAPEDFSVQGSTLFFSAGETYDDSHLWKTDGTTPGTVIVSNTPPGYLNDDGSSIPMITFNGALFFAANDGVHGLELWRSDGSAAGTALFKDIYPQVESAAPHEITAIGNTIFFTAVTTTTNRGYLELWQSDGTATTKVANLSQPTDGDYYQGASLTAVGNLLFFTSSNPSGDTLWKTNGATTTSVTGSGNAERLTAVGTALYFTSDDKLYKTDGTTVTLVPPPATGEPLSYPAQAKLINVNGTLLFTAFDGTALRLWKTDGTTTTRVANHAAAYNHFELDWAVVAGTLFFTVEDESDPASEELWKTDGTTSARVTTFRPARNADDTQGLWSLTAAGSTLFFRVNDGVSGDELWASDGSAAGTRRVADINPGAAGSRSFWGDWMRALGSSLVFTADDGSNKVELWKSDGTAAGTVKLKDVVPLPTGSDDQPGAVINDKLLLTVFEPAIGFELWQSDGTAAGTTLVQDIAPGNNNATPQGFTLAGNNIFFSAYTQESGRELWALPAAFLGAQPPATPAPTLTPAPQGTLLAADGTVTTVGGTLTGTLSASAPDGVKLTFSIVANGTKGTAQIVPSLSVQAARATTTVPFTYTPQPGARGADSFTFKVSDGTHDSNVATVNVRISGAGVYLPLVTN